jgi:uncharacterized protein (TIGR02599 family)
MTRLRPRIPRRRTAFTILELLVAMAVFLLMLVIIFSVFSQTAKTVRSTSSKIDAMKTARAGFDLISKNLRQATLNTYQDYDNATNPTTYLRKSDLHFFIAPTAAGNAVFFQSLGDYSTDATLGETTGLLSAFGFYVEYNNDTGTGTRWARPAHISSNRWRYRLMQWKQPSETLSVFSDTNSRAWTNSASSEAWPVADNIIAIIFWPRLSLSDDATGSALTGDYTYDSRSTTNATQSAQLPPSVEVTMVAIDESSAQRFMTDSTAPAVIQNALKDRFQVSTIAQYQKDLAALETDLSARGIAYQIFTTSIPLRSSAWSKD